MLRVVDRGDVVGEVVEARRHESRHERRLPGARRGREQDRPPVTRRRGRVQEESGTRLGDGALVHLPDEIRERKGFVRRRDQAAIVLEQDDVRRVGTAFEERELGRCRARRATRFEDVIDDLLQRRVRGRDGEREVSARNVGRTKRFSTVAPA